MSVVISGDFVLTQVADFPLTEDHPVIGWHNIVTSTNVSADTEEQNYPASNVGNPATHLEWRADDTTEQYLTITTGFGEDIDYLAIAKHNLSSGEIPVSIGYFDTSSPPVWVELISEMMLVDDGPVLFRFTAQSLATIEIKLGSGVDPARIAVVYVGQLLTLERKIYVGHTPMPHGRKNDVQNGMSETGNFLGRVVLGSWRESTIPLSLIDPDWYREYMDPFLAVAASTPFFFAWRPETYPLEVGYGWLTEDPAPTPAGQGGNRIAFDLKVRGVV